MTLPDGTKADVSALTHDADSVVVTATVTLPDGRTLVGFLALNYALTATAGVLKAPGLGNPAAIAVGPGAPQG